MASPRAIAMVVVMLVAAACQAGPLPDRASPNASEALPSPSATAEATDKPAAPTPIVFYEVTKNDEGAHGGAPALDLGGPIAVEYTFQGTCTVTISVFPETGAVPYSKLTIEVAGPPQSGVWRLTVPQGRYYVSPDEAVGCTFHVLVRADT